VQVVSGDIWCIVDDRVRRTFSRDTQHFEGLDISGMCSGIAELTSSQNSNSSQG
jgi:hypothetical protein